MKIIGSIKKAFTGGYWFVMYRPVGSKKWKTAKAPDMLFWASVYKAICGINGAPKDVLEKAHTWLSRNGFSIPS